MTGPCSCPQGSRAGATSSLEADCSPESLPWAPKRTSTEAASVSGAPAWRCRFISLLRLAAREGRISSRKSMKSVKSCIRRDS